MIISEFDREELICIYNTYKELIEAYHPVFPVPQLYTEILKKTKDKIDELSQPR